MPRSSRAGLLLRTCWDGLCAAPASSSKWAGAADGETLGQLPAATWAAGEADPPAKEGIPREERQTPKLATLH